MKRISVLFITLAFLAAMTTCKHKPDLTIAPPTPTPPTPSPGYKCSQDTVYFQNTVFPLILSNCAKSGCHDQTTHKHGLTLDSYSNIMNLVTPFNPQQSTLYLVLFSGEENETMPPGAPFTTNQRSIIYYWIQQGALNNQCTSAGCDSTNVTYTSSINPIIQNWCIGCHGSSNPGGGISLTSYSQVVTAVNSGRLMGAIRQQSGYYAMPKGGKLSDCEIALFQIWINHGEPQ